MQTNQKTAITQHRGGCFSLILSPIYFIFLLMTIFLMANGETTQPWDLTAYTKLDQELSTPAHSPALSRLFTPEVLYWESSILQWSAEWDLDPNLVATVMQIESCGDPTALSPAGAMGLFQVMPYHFSAEDTPYTPDTNAMRGLAYLRQAMDTYNTVRLSLASYNGGIGTAAKPESSWPDETTRYVYWGTNIYQDASEGKATSPTLDEWLTRGGASLCSHARERLGLAP
jgi:soluble lytic murein transglycosylase-like protein